MSIKSNDLFQKVLIDPLKEADTLYVVSGYATATMAVRHLEYAKSIKSNLSIRLIVGMCPQDGLENRNHIGFTDLQTQKYGADFRCNYIVDRPPVHSKVYAWYKGQEPIKGFIGSANYTQNAFSSSMRETLTQEDASECFSYYQSLLGETVNCAEERVSSLIDIFEKKPIQAKDIETEARTAETFAITGLEKITLSLLDSRTGETPKRSGINWGQREGREPNQAYINIPSNIGQSDFFPNRFETFTVVTDDGKQFICVRAQDNGKGLHTTLNNSLLGEYLRYRLGLKNGQYVFKADLLKYGRTDIDFYKIDDENYYLDFSVHQ